MPAILIVDDEEANRALYLKAFGTSGLNVRWASNAQQASNILIVEPIDLVVLDIEMPRINGMTMYEVIKDEHPQLKVIINSAHPVERQKELVPGAFDYYDKSEGLMKLVFKINDLLSTKTLEEKLP